jgi:hypothetical protein
VEETFAILMTRKVSGLRSINPLGTFNKTETFHIQMNVLTHHPNAFSELIRAIIQQKPI